MATKAVLSAALSLRKLLIVPKNKKGEAKAMRIIEVKAAKENLVKAKIAESIFACLTYDLFCKLFIDDT